MRTESLEFLRQLLQTPSVSGYEGPVQEIVRRWAREYAEEVRTDLHGNVIAVLNPRGFPRIMLAGHCDQIGLQVRYIDDDGYLWFGTVGGFDPMVLLGQRVTVWSAKGPIPGVIARKPPHVLEEKERKEIKIDQLWIDIGAKDKEEAQSLVQIGDPVTYELGMRLLRNDLVCSPGLDDKMGTFVVMEALRLLSQRRFEGALFAVSTVQEEVGLRGAQTSTFGIEPQVGIAVDVTFATDYPGMEKKKHGDIRLYGGPVITRGPNINPKVFELLVETARRKEIPHQIDASPRPTGTDANAMQVSRSGVATGLVSVPNRYMHSPVEYVALPDLEHTAQLLAEFVVAVKADTDFTP